MQGGSYGEDSCNRHTCISGIREQAVRRKSGRSGNPTGAHPMFRICISGKVGVDRVIQEKERIMIWYEGKRLQKGRVMQDEEAFADWI